ncbi:MAG TPA: acyltransferase family protein [Burkholderiales bacterium]|nr:acyltransferase family protein [Burkholderiales bacterium]
MPTIEHQKYRPDIDALRAIAVLFVLGFHAFPSILPGGFAGVDVFFVISGYLITGIILSDLQQERFSLLAFYERRVRRIFPALIIVLLSCLLAGFFLLKASEYKSLAWHALGGALFSSNLILWHETGYFDSAALMKPLLHLWSLGIEEQFYIVWPLLIWLTCKRRVHTWIIGAIMVLSFIVWAGDTDATARFYSPASRAWELCLGAILTTVRVRSTALAILGLILMAVGFAVIREGAAWLMLLPTIGTALVLVSGIKSPAALTYIGKISYPLYLWHWPLLSFASIVNDGLPGRTARLVLVVLSFPLAWATYRFLEKPRRFRPRTLVAAMCGVAIVGLSLFLSNGIASRYGNPQNDLLTRDYKVALDQCDWKAKDLTVFCSSSENPKIAVIGDSHATHLLYGFEREHIDIALLATGSCPPAIGVENAPGCGRHLTEALRFIRDKPSIHYVVLSAYSRYFDGNPELGVRVLSGYQRTIDNLRAQNLKVIFVVDGPEFRVSPEQCAPAPWLRQRLAHACPLDLMPRAIYEKSIASLKAANPDVKFLDAFSALCSDTCVPYKDGRMLFTDEHHLSTYGSTLVVSRLLNLTSEKEDGSTASAKVHPMQTFDIEKAERKKVGG